VATALFGLAALPVAMAAQSYGLGEQVLTVGAPAFRGWTGPGRIDGTDGYLYPRNTNDSGFVAPVVLPDGAVITQICLYARNEDPSDTFGLWSPLSKKGP
jgi:hypothetical protein